MKKATHFGAGNIGRGFIGEVLSENHFSIDFIDVNPNIINALKKEGAYSIEIAKEGKPIIEVSSVFGINSKENPEDVIASIVESSLITTAIGPNILPIISELIAKGLEKRFEKRNFDPIDIIACENMIGGSQYLFENVKKYLSDETLKLVDQYVGFPNAAVDRIVPAQSHEDPLYVVVEEFKEWVVESSKIKNSELVIKGIHYVDNLEPYIERKLFSVNTGHATAAYTGAYYGAKTILEALENKDVEKHVLAVFKEIRSLLVSKWNFSEQELLNYHSIILSRFKNPFIIDDISRVARTPIRKLGYNERFIRPIRELKERNLSYENLISIVAFVFKFYDESDEQSVELQQRLLTTDLPDLVKEITGLSDSDLVNEIVLKIKG